MEILITGGAGFFGLHMAKRLSKSIKGCRILLLDVIDSNKKEYPSGCRFIRGDVRDKKLMMKITKHTNIIIHAAAALPLRSREEILEVNINGTRNLLEAAVRNKIRQFVYISSTAVYGVPKVHPIDEKAALVGVGPYGESKIYAEKLCGKYRKKGLTVTVIRPKTFVGTHRLGVFEILFDWIKDGKKIPVIGDGTNRYQLLDVDDLTEAIYLIISAKNKAKVNGIFNIGAEKYDTVGKDLQTVFDYARSGSEIMPTPAFLVKKALWFFEKMKLSPLYQWVYDTADKDSYVSVNKLMKTLKWHPRYSNSQALIKSYRWYLNNYDEIKSRPAGTTHTVGWKQGILGLFKKFF